MREDRSKETRWSTNHALNLDDSQVCWLKIALLSRAKAQFVVASRGPRCSMISVNLKATDVVTRRDPLQSQVHPQAATPLQIIDWR